MKSQHKLLMAVSAAGLLVLAPLVPADAKQESTAGAATSQRGGGTSGGSSGGGQASQPRQSAGGSDNSGGSNGGGQSARRPSGGSSNNNSGPRPGQPLPSSNRPPLPADPRPPLPSTGQSAPRPNPRPNPANGASAPANPQSAVERAHQAREDALRRNGLNGRNRRTSTIPWWGTSRNGWNYDSYGDGYRRGDNYDNDRAWDQDRDRDGPRPQDDAPAPGNGVGPAAEEDIPPSLRQVLEASPAWRAATEDLTRAQTEYETELNRVLDALGDKPEYRRALARRERVQRELDRLRGPDGASPEELTPMATERMKANQAVTKLETQAVAADPQASASKKRLAQVAARRNAVRAEIEASPAGT